MPNVILIDVILYAGIAFVTWLALNVLVGIVQGVYAAVRDAYKFHRKGL